MSKRLRSLAQRYPPSAPCSCEICLSYCKRPGWWTVKEATGAIKAGYSQRMMLEVAPERSFGVLSPSFYGCEGTVALNQFASNGCNFLKNNLCELYATGCQPLECRFCHHDRVGLGPVCHASLEKDWFTPAGRALIAHWCRITGIWDMLSLYGLDRLRKTG